MKIIIVGAGKVGRALVKELQNEGHDLVVIDRNNDIVDLMVNRYDILGICGDGTLCSVLDEADVKNAFLVIAATISDETNILTCMIAKKMGAEHTFARVRRPEYSEQLSFMRENLGIDMLISPDKALASEISLILEFPSATNIETFAQGKIVMVEISVKDRFPIVGQSIKEISDKYKNKFLICAVKRGDEVFIPNGDFVINDKDKMYVTGARRNLTSFFKEIGALKQKVKNVMIIGGSKIAQYLAATLDQYNMSVTILERNRERCCELNNKLSNSINIHTGNSNDHQLLMEENIDKMDAVVSLTDSDEVNFLASIYAETFNLRKVITKMNGPGFLALFEQLGHEGAVSVTTTTTNMIVQYVRSKSCSDGSEMINFYKLVNGKVEAAEFAVNSNVQGLVNIYLKDCNLRRDILIAVIRRSNNIIFPTGNDMIKIGDSVIIVTNGRPLGSLRDILA